MANYDKMLEVQKENIKINIENAIQAVEELFYKNKPLTMRDIASFAGVSVNFLYAHNEIMEKIDYYKSIPSNEVTLERINLVIKDNKRLEEKILLYTNLLIDQQF